MWLEAHLDVESAVHVVVPYLGVDEEAAGLQFRMTVYSDLPQEEEVLPPSIETPQEESELCFCAKCRGRKSPFQLLIEKMTSVEIVMDERIKFLESLVHGA